MVPMFVHVISKQGLYILHMLYRNVCLLKVNFFILSGNLLLRESPFHIASCLKLFDFKLFFVYTLNLLRSSHCHIMFALL